MIKATAFHRLRKNLLNFVFPLHQEYATKVAKVEYDKQRASYSEEADSNSVIQQKMLSHQ